MTREGWAAILEEIFSFERDPELGRLLFIALLALISIIVAIYLKIQGKKDEEKGNNTNNYQYGNLDNLHSCFIDSDLLYTTRIGESHMKVLIEIDKVFYEAFSTCRHTPLTVLESTLMNAIGSGKPINEDATNYEAAKIVFGKETATEMICGAKEAWNKLFKENDK